MAGLTKVKGSGIEDGTLSVDDIADNAITEAKIADAAVVSLKSGRKNLIINGDFQVSQRGDYTTAGAITTNAYFVDRWFTPNTNINATYAHTDVVLPNGINTKAIKVTAGASATGYGQLRQKVEFNKKLVGQTVTISAWIRTTKTSTTGFGLGLYETVSGWTIWENSLNDGDWHFISQTLTLPTNMSSYLEVAIQHNNAWVVGEYYEVALLQLELGSVATDFEHRSFGEELALCQRYCQIYTYSDGGGIGTKYGLNAITNRFSAAIVYPVVMREIPTLTELTAPATVRCTAGSHTVEAASLTIRINTTSSGDYRMYGGSYYLDAEL